ncbi:MAG: alpha/beta hydrolase [Pleurocapsa minor GSE-CHR-MK-17-07R]|nr:alpha/beta hydrolase [Pleurocapsa minor GSE-CHR-MK 17-07R]
MATLVTEQGIVHYEAYGRGRPVLLLHGWMNSWAVWRDTIQLLGRDFRMYALDFLGFGDSGDQAKEFSVTNFSLMVNTFMDRMGIVKAPLVGHSMGGTVSLSVALAHPDKIVKVIVVGSPIVGSSLSPLLKLAANRQWIGLGQSAPGLYSVFQAGFRPLLRGYSYFLAKDGNMLGKMLTDDVAKLNLEPFIESITTLRETDLRPRLADLKMPILGIYGKKDLIVDPKQSQVLKQFAPTSRISWFENSGHFPMMDEPERFHLTIKDFLNNG